MASHHYRLCTNQLGSQVFQILPLLPPSHHSFLQGMNLPASFICPRDAMFSLTFAPVLHPEQSFPLASFTLGSGLSLNIPLLGSLPLTPDRLSQLYLRPSVPCASPIMTGLSVTVITDFSVCLLGTWEVLCTSIQHSTRHIVATQQITTPE